MYDPLRLQFLTISLDSEVMLTLLGIVVAGLVVRAGARRLGLPAAGLWDSVLDGAFWTILGARLGWIATHLDYYARAPIQAVAIGDGGFSFATGVLAAAWVLMRARRALGLAPADFAQLAGPAIAAAFVLNRAGCALTACGTGIPSGAPWALVRSDVSVHPVGLYGMIVWLSAWAAIRSPWAAGDSGLVWLLAAGALVAERGIGWGLGHESSEGALAASALLGAVAVVRWSTRLRAPPATATIAK